MMGDMWQANRPGLGPTDSNNFVTGYANRFKYWNLSDRVDYNVSSKLRVFGRYNQFRTFTVSDDWTGGSAAFPLGWFAAPRAEFLGDAVYTLSTTTILDVRGAYNSINDSFGVPSRQLKASDLQKFWPGNSWYTPYLKDTPQIYYPGIAGYPGVRDECSGQGGLLVPDAELVQHRLQNLAEYREALREGRGRVSAGQHQRLAAAVHEIRFHTRGHSQHFQQSEYRPERRRLGQFSPRRRGAQFLCLQHPDSASA